MVYQAGTMTDSAKKNMLNRLYHGDPDDASANMSLVDQLLKGYGKFQSLLHKVPVACNDDGNTASTKFLLQLKDCLTQDASANLFVGKQITHCSLISKSLIMRSYLTKDERQELVQGREEGVCFLLDSEIWDNTKYCLPSGKQDPNF
jgi:hypothetical protein